MSLTSEKPTLPTTLNIAQALFWIANHFGGYLDEADATKMINDLPKFEGASEPSLFLTMMKFRSTGGNKSMSRNITPFQREEHVQSPDDDWFLAEKKLLNALVGGDVIMNGRAGGISGESVLPISSYEFEQVIFRDRGSDRPHALYPTKPDKFWDMLRLPTAAIISEWPLPGSLAVATQPEAAPKPQRRRGRPHGTGLALSDEPKVQQAIALLESGQALSIADAVRKVVGAAEAEASARKRIERRVSEARWENKGE